MCRSDHNVLINLQQDKCYSLLCNFIISIRMEKCYTLNVREWGILYILDYNVLLQRWRACKTKHRQNRATRARTNGVDPMWSQVCSSVS